MKCQRCGFESSAEMHFCGKCGYELTSPSGLSGKDHPLEEKITRIQRYLPEGLTKKILLKKDRIEEERRQVAITFCDRKGFTLLTHKLGPEETFVRMAELKRREVMKRVILLESIVGTGWFELWRRSHFHLFRERR